MKAKRLPINRYGNGFDLKKKKRVNSRLSNGHLILREHKNACDKIIKEKRYNQIIAETH